MSDRRDPDALSWLITPETVFLAEQSFHALPGDAVAIERYDDDNDTWIEIDYETERLRLTIYRNPVSEEAP